jgi:hypothetical protein
LAELCRGHAERIENRNFEILSQVDQRVDGAADDNQHRELHVAL